MIGTYLVVEHRAESSLACAGVPRARRDGEAFELRVARIVETEAYCGPRDLACHARVGLTPRTRTLLGPPGHAYVFLVYGMHECFNATCLAEGAGHAVLVRGVEPVRGVAPGLRGDGPGRLTRALGITRRDDAADLVTGRIYLLPRTERPRIEVTARVGVAYAGAWADRPWRFLDPTSAHTSRPAARFIGRGVDASAAPAKPDAPRTSRAARPALRRSRSTRPR